MKFNKRHAKQIIEFTSKMDKRGCLPVSEWTSGSGRFTKPKTLPPFVKRYERSSFAGLERTQWPHHGTPERAAFDFLMLDKKNSRKKAVLALDINAWHTFMTEACRGKEF